MHIIVRDNLPPLAWNAPGPLILMKNELDILLAWAFQAGVSDTILSSGNPPAILLNGKVVTIIPRLLGRQEMQNLANQISEGGGSGVQAGKDFDFAYEVPNAEKTGYYRFRANITGSVEGVAITMRSIPERPPTIESYGMEPELAEAMLFEKGLGIMTGATGSGKSTFLSAILHTRIITEEKNFISYESPPEFIYTGLPGAKCIVTQTDVPNSLPSYAHAVRNSLRRAPHIVLVGEARDAETISGMIAEVRTGHAVYSTMHTETAPGTLDRAIREFPQPTWESARISLLDSLKVIAHQRLIPTVDGKRTAIREWIVFDEELKEYLLDLDMKDVTKALNRHIRGEPVNGDRKSLDTHVREVFLQGKISVETYHRVLISIGIKKETERAKMHTEAFHRKNTHISLPPPEELTKEDEVLETVE